MDGQKSEGIAKNGESGSTAHEEEQQGLLDVIMAIDLRSDGTRKLVIHLGHHMESMKKGIKKDIINIETNPERWRNNIIQVGNDNDIKMEVHGRRPPAPRFSL